MCVLPPQVTRWYLREMRERRSCTHMCNCMVFCIMYDYIEYGKWNAHLASNNNNQKRRKRAFRYKLGGIRFEDLHLYWWCCVFNILTRTVPNNRTYWTLWTSICDVFSVVARKMHNIALVRWERVPFVYVRKTERLLRCCLDANVYFIKGCIDNGQCHCEIYTYVVHVMRSQLS